MNRYYTVIIYTFICFYHCLLYSQPISFTHTTILNPVTGFTAFSDCAVDMDDNHLDDVVRVGAKGFYIDYQQIDGSYTQKFFPMTIQVPPRWSVCAGDLDNNGFNDLLFADTESVSFLKSNQDGTAYVETVMPSFLVSQRSTMADIDNDGWLDAFVCNDTSMSIPFRNVGLGNMIPDTNLIHTSKLPGSYSAIWIDFDNDTDIDLYISKCLAGAAPGNIVRNNLLYQNNGDGSFTEVATSFGLEDNAQSWSTVIEDFDNDGDLDAFIINHDFQNRLFRNNGDGTFTDVISLSGIESIGLDVEENAAGDFNNDGYVDIFSDLEQELYLGHGDLTFTGQDAPSAPGAIADLNDDGFLDITKNSQVWLNDGNDENHWLKIFPFGLISNRNGIGARVEIYGSWGIQIREVRSGQSYSPMSSLTVHFGLGNEESIDSLKIKWPSGIISVLKNLHADTSYLVPEGSCLASIPPVENSRIELCIGDTILLEAPKGFAHYLWSNGDTSHFTKVVDTGKYFSLLTDEEGCIAISNYTDVVTAKDVPPTITALPSRRICEGQSIILSSSPGENHFWSNGMTAEQIVVTSSGSYMVSIDAKCSDSQIMSAPFEVEFMDAPPAVVIDQTVGQGDSIIISAMGENCHWYDQAIGGELLYVGCDFQTPILTDDIVYYLENHPFYPGEFQSGGKSDDMIPDGISVQTGFLLFEAWEPFTLLSVQVYLPEEAEEGIRFVQLVNSDTLLAFKQFNITKGWNQLDLNFHVPVGEFSLLCPQGNLSRDTANLSYPYSIGDTGQIINSSFGKNFYYYFYDWHIKKEDIECVSDRIPVVVTITNTEELNSRNNIEVFPNPVCGEMTIRLAEASIIDPLLRIFDQRGKQIRQKELVGGTDFSIQVDELTPGIYYVQIIQDTQITIKKIVLF